MLEVPDVFDIDGFGRFDMLSQNGCSPDWYCQSYGAIFKVYVFDFDDEYTYEGFDCIRETEGCNFAIVLQAQPKPFALLRPTQIMVVRSTENLIIKTVL